MTEALRALRTRAIILALIELSLAGFFILFWFQNWFAIQSYIPVSYLVVAIAVVVCVDVLFMWIELLSLSKIRQKSDLNAATLIGSDVQEAYNFGQIGLVVVDEHNKVMWDNNLFKDRKIDLLDLNILEWQPSFADFKGAPVDKVISIEVAGHYYDVKYLPDAHLYIFKDSSDFVTLSNSSQEQAIVIGIIMIDNYNDVAGNAEDSNDIISKVRAVIFDYAKQYNVLLRRITSDSYFAVCNFSDLCKMEDDNFSILEHARALASDVDVAPTLSIGFACNFPDVNKLNEMASGAIGLAMSRGGDQAVVTPYSSDSKFYGGKTAAIESTSKVKARSIGDAVISLIKSSSNVFIMGHTELDMDALGSCLGIKTICDWFHKPSKIIFDEKLAEQKARFAFKAAFSKEDLDAMVVTPKEALAQVNDSSLLFVLDVSRPSLVMAPDMLEKCSKTVVIDHHRRADEFIDHAVLTYIEPSASSASELVIDMIHYASVNPKIVVKPNYATLMLAGIFLDTNYFRSKSTGMRTFEAAEILKEYGADNSVADDDLKDEYEVYKLINKIVSNMKTPYTGIVYCVADEKDIIERSTLAKVANTVMQVKDINACFVIGRTDEKQIRISARSDGSINVQLLVEKMGGGGHFQQAAAVFEGNTLARVESMLLDTLKDYLDSAKSVADDKEEQ